MPIIVLDGPEAAGKTTLSKEIVRQLGTVTVRPWGRLGPDYFADARYLEPLKEDVATHVSSGEWSVWDRSWASGSVYGQFQRRSDRLTEDPFMGEWLYGRAIDAVGVKVMVLGPSADVLTARRQLRLAQGDTDDIPCDPVWERREFKEHALRYGWVILKDVRDVRAVAATLVDLARTKAAYTGEDGPLPPVYAGPPMPQLLVVGESRNQNGKVVPPGGWLCLTSRYTTMLGRTVMKSARWDETGWINADECPLDLITGVSGVILAGGRAQAWYDKEVRPKIGRRLERVLRVPHPAWLYRWGRARDEVTGVEDSIREFVRNDD